MLFRHSPAFYIVRVLRISVASTFRDLIGPLTVASRTKIRPTCVLRDRAPRTGCPKNFLIYRQLGDMLTMAEQNTISRAESATKNVYWVVGNDISLTSRYRNASGLRRIKAFSRRMPSRNYEGSSFSKTKRKSAKQKSKNRSSLVWSAPHNKIIYWCQLFRTFEELPFSFASRRSNARFLAVALAFHLSYGKRHA